MRFIVTSNKLLENLLKLKHEVRNSPILAMLEDFLFELNANADNSKARKAGLKSAIARLKLLKSSKVVNKLRRLVFNTKYLRHLKNFFSYSSRTSNVVIIRRILLKLLKKSPQDEPAVYFLKRANSIFHNKNFTYANKTIGHSR